MKAAATWSKRDQQNSRRKTGYLLRIALKAFGEVINKNKQWYKESSFRAEDNLRTDFFLFYKQGIWLRALITVLLLSYLKRQSWLKTKYWTRQHNILAQIAKYFKFSIFKASVFFTIMQVTRRWTIQNSTLLVNTTS